MDSTRKCHEGRDRESNQKMSIWSPRNLLHLALLLGLSLWIAACNNQDRQPEQHLEEVPSGDTNENQHPDAQTSRDSLHFILAAGKIERQANFSSEFISPRNIDVWLPDGYSEEKSYPVLYMQDGQMLFDPTKTWNAKEWEMDEMVDFLSINGRMVAIIVVGIHSVEGDRYEDYLPEGPLESLAESDKAAIAEATNFQGKKLFDEALSSNDYVEFLTKELKPFIDEKYATKSEKENTYIGGSSMGGLISLYAMGEHPEVFGGAACFSPHWLGTFDTLNNPIPSQLLEYLAQSLPKWRDNQLYMDSGGIGLDRHYLPYIAQADSIIKATTTGSEEWYVFQHPSDDHNEDYWKNRLPQALVLLLASKH